MSQLPEERRPPLTPQLALRVAVVGSFALAMFAIIFFRLWFLQVLSGDHYLAQASTNRTREIAIAAPRGEILDRNGTILVDSVQRPAIQLSPPDLPASPRAQQALFRRLAAVLAMPTKPERCKVISFSHNRIIVRFFRLALIPCEVRQQLALVPYGNVTVKRDVRPDVQYYLAERENEFPGVNVAQVYLPTYPKGTLAAQLLGTVGPISPKELGKPAYLGIPKNAVVGQAGLEGYYNRYLQGSDGAEQVQIDAFGHPTGDVPKVHPIAGHNLALSLDANLQRAGEQALATSIAANPGANGGAFVALNPSNGEVYGMGSYPTFDPSVFTKTLSEATYKRLTSPADGAPLLNRAIQSAGPTGSTFKPITATAALQSGAWSLGDTYNDTGQFCFSVGGSCLHNAGHAVYGSLDLRNAIRVSSDDFFYNLGAKTNADPVAHPNGGPLDQWARAYGIGQLSGVDLPGEASGTLPTPRWRAHQDQVELQCERKRHVPSCGIADKNPWTIGDNVNLAVGQGDVQVTPVQLAVAYSALANGGTIVRPHLGLDAQNPDGTVAQKIDPPASRHIAINSLYLETIRQGLRDAASQPGGTSYDVFGNFPEAVYGKTGTAQYNGQPDYSWYACFVPASATSKPIVVVVHIERGGFGDVAAAPVARQILSQWFFGKAGAFKAGTSATR